MAEKLKNDPETLRQEATKRAHARQARRLENRAKFIRDRMKNCSALAHAKLKLTREAKRNAAPTGKV